MRERSRALEAQVLHALDATPAEPQGLAVAPAHCAIVCPEYETGAVALDLRRGWHDQPEQKRRACQIGFAAEELQEYLRQITGVTVPIAASPRASAVVLALSAGPFEGDDGWRITPSEEGCAIHGATPRSLLWGVYAFLEAQGCRWYGLGAQAQVVPRCSTVRIPPATIQAPSFPLRFLMAGFGEKVPAALWDWFGKNRMNLWSADSDQPGQRRRGIELMAGTHCIHRHAGFSGNFDISDGAQRGRFLDAVVGMVRDGVYRDLDYVSWLGDDCGSRAQSPGMAALGTATDQDIFLLHEMRQALDAATAAGTLNRRLKLFGWAYFDTMRPPTRPLPDGFDAVMGFWEQADPRFALDDPEADHSFLWPSRVTETEVEHRALPSNRGIWEMLTSWPCRLGYGDYYLRARNFFLPHPLVTVITETAPTLAARGALYYSFMHTGMGFWGLMEPMHYLLGRLVWDVNTDVPTTLAEYFSLTFGDDAKTAVRCLFAMERGMLGSFWVRGYLAQRLNLVALHDLHEPFWVWGDYYRREDLLLELDDLREAARLARQLEGTERGCLWLAQIRYALAMHSLYVHAVDAYEAARQAGLWHFCRRAAESFTRACEQLRRLAAVNLPTWSRNVQYYPRPLLEQTLIGPALERMARNLGIALPEEAAATERIAFDPWSRRRKPPLSEELWRHGDQPPHVCGEGNTRWCQPYADRERVYVVGWDREATPQRSLLRAIDLAEGRTVWEVECQDRGYSALQSYFMGVQRDDSGLIRSLLIREAHANPRRPSAIVRLDADTGTELWRLEDPPQWPHSGNGRALLLDLDGDGRLEVVDSACAHVALLDFETGAMRWRYDDHVRICHGGTAPADIDGDGRDELVFGSEYSEDAGTSRLVVLRGDGSVGWLSGGHPHDLGSTETHVLDVDGDGRLEILHVGIDLLGQARLPFSELYCWEADGNLRYRAPLGGSEVLLADCDGDGAVEAVSITSGRDGGYAIEPEIVCLDAATGARKWRTPIHRTYGAMPLLAADFDGDRLPEALVMAGQFKGYGHVPGQPAWGDLYLVNGAGEIAWQSRLLDTATAALLGTPEAPEGIILAGGDGIIRRIAGAHGRLERGLRGHPRAPAPRAP